MPPRAFADKPIEAVQDYWNRRPCNIRHSPLEVGTREYYDEVETRKYFVEPHIPGFADFSRWAGKRVLEIGCGIGTDTITFARHGARVTAVDLSEESLKVARQRAAVFGLGDRIDFRQANAEELTRYVTPEPYDLIYSFGVIHHTPQVEKVVSQMRAYAHPGTTVKVMVYHRWSWKVFAILMREGKGRVWRLSEEVARHSEAQTGCPVTYVYSRREGRRLLEAAGFRVRKVEVGHVFPYSIPEYVRYEYRKVWYFRWMPHRLFRGFERQFGWHLCLTAEA
ncbi:MAG: Methyltransferase type 12 [Gemmataceae bacterium]|nr:Methyltransferase type 12 [Gemmataceae bacterium]